ncbi:MAG: putative metal-binding motif-containing protein, partial [Chitinophagales bacterium]|nr:putative metal-binding motif-containing protein [Chitinophagales bacterium]
MHNPRIILAILVSLPIFLNGQVSEIQWLKNHGGSGSDFFEKIIFTSDSNYLAVGYTTSDDFDIVTITGSYDYFVAKFDTLGNTLWTKTYGGSESDKCYTVIETPEGNFLLAGDSFSNDGDVSATHALQNAWVLLINKDGEIIWSKTYGGSINDSVKGITKNSNNNYVLCGETNSNDGNVSGNHQFGTYDYWVFEITVDGTLVRQKCFGGTDDDKSSNLINGNLSDYLVIGYSASTDGDVMTYDESFHLWAINFDSLFNLNWVFGFGGASDDRGYSAVLTEDSNFILTGEVFSEELPGFIGGIRDAIIIKLDTNGNLVWVNFFGGSDGESINHISHSFGENYLLIGHATSSDGDIPSNTGLNDVFVSEISSDGIVLETIVFGGSHEDIGHGIIGSSISDFVAVGDFYSDDYDFPTNYGYKDAFILKYHECTQSFYKDTDSDGFGDVLTDSVACDIPAGYVSDSTDCNDTNPDIHPFLSDICNSIDDNCNGVTDEDAIFVTYFLDNDGDLFGNELMDSISCNILI